MRRTSQTLPLMAAALVPRELQSWGFAAIVLGALEGGLLGVIVKYQYQDVAPVFWLNLAVALVAAAPAFTNLASFLFASYSQGRNKPLLMCRLIELAGVCLIFLALAPISEWGLAYFCLMTIAARAAWAGVLTVRSVIWRANFQREWRARVTARIVQVSSLIVAGYAALTGFMVEWSPDGFRWMFGIAALCAFLSARRYRTVRMRQHRRLVEAETLKKSGPVGQGGLSMFWRVLSSDRDFRNYMTSMMLFGGGNLMLVPLLIIILDETLGVRQSLIVVFTSSLPLAMLFVAVRGWALLLDKRHIFTYRAIHSWTIVASMCLFLAAVTLSIPWLLWPASMALGAAMAGAHLGWNLGTNDFASDADAAQYMAVHVTLTGLRGLFMPLLGIMFYQWLISNQVRDAASIALLLPLSLSSLGALRFVWLSREMTLRQTQT